MRVNSGPEVSVPLRTLRLRAECAGDLCATVPGWRQSPTEQIIGPSKALR